VTYYLHYEKANQEVNNKINAMAALNGMQLTQDCPGLLHVCWACCWRHLI